MVKVSVMVTVSIRTSWVVNFVLFRCYRPAIYTRPQLTHLLIIFCFNVYNFINVTLQVTHHRTRGGSVLVVYILHWLSPHTGTTESQLRFEARTACLRLLFVCNTTATYRATRQHQSAPELTTQMTKSIFTQTCKQKTQNTSNDELPNAHMIT